MGSSGHAGVGASTYGANMGGSTDAGYAPGTSPEDNDTANQE